MTVSTEEELVSVKEELSKERKRSELLIYPALVAFIILSTYGFYKLNVITLSMESMSQDATMISRHLESISDHISKNE